MYVFIHANIFVYACSNMRNHYTLTHPNNDYPEKYLLSDDEIKKLKALRFK